MVNEVGNLTNLQVLYVNNTQVDLLPSTIGTLVNLTDLNFGSTRITLIPDEIGNLTELTRLVGAPNNIASIPNEIGLLTKLTYLDFSNCAIFNLPTGFSQLTALETLYLNDNDLQVVAGLNQFSGLKYLRLHNNRLGEDNPNFNTDLPDDLGTACPNIEELTLHNNKLTKLPSTIGSMIGLTSLELQSNRLTSLPSTIGNLTNLIQLDLHSNELESLPISINNLVNLNLLNIKNNKISNELNLSNLELLNDLNIELNNIPSLKLAVSPTIFGTDERNPYSNRFHAQRNACGCIEVPSDELVSWQLSFYNEVNNIIDNGVVYSDDCASVTTNSIPPNRARSLNSFIQRYHR